MGATLIFKTLSIVVGAVVVLFVLAMLMPFMGFQ